MMPESEKLYTLISWMLPTESENLYFYFYFFTYEKLATLCWNLEIQTDLVKMGPSYGCDQLFKWNECTDLKESFLVHLNS